MRSASWLDGLRPSPPNRRARRAPRPAVRRKPPARPPLSVETLDDRIVPGFLAPADYPTGLSPYAVVSADFNGDGKPDLVAANFAGDSISVWLGNGNGTFQPAKTLVVAKNPSYAAPGDFDACFRDLFPRVARTAALVARDPQLGPDIAQEAFARLRKASQVSGRPMKVVAEAVVATFDRD